MTTDPDPDEIIWTDKNGIEQCLEDECLAALLRDGGNLLALPITYLDYKGEKKQTTGLFVNCNDLFAWGSADMEELPFDEIASLYKAWKSGRFGVSKWCCLRRNQRPQMPVERRMREAGAWDEAMEALPLNTRDAEVHAMVAAAVAAQREREGK